MSIRISCPHCERAYHLADTQRGKTIRCKECQGTFKVEDQEDDRPRAKPKAPPPLPQQTGEDAADGAPARDNGAPEFEEEIPFSRPGLLKSLLWLILWLVICVGFAIGMPILGYLAVTRQGVNLNAIIPLVICVLATVVGIGGTIGALPSLRLFLLSTIPSSSHYLISGDRLRRYSHRGKVLEDIPFGNIAEVRLVTRRLTEVLGEGADQDVKAKILHINLRNPEHKKTVVDYHFLRWSQKVHDADLAVSEDFIGVPIKTAYKKLKKRWQQWQEGPGREESDAAYRAPKRRRQPWYKSPAVMVSAVLGVLALGGLTWFLIAALKPREQPVAEGPNPKQQPPQGEGPNPKQKQVVVEGQNPKQQPPDKGPLEKLNPRAVPGLTAYWPLNEGQGTLALDEAGKLPAVVRGGEWIQGIKGPALRFNGTSDYVDLRDDPRLNVARGAPFTLAGWAAAEGDRGAICAFRKAKGFGVISVLVFKGNLRGWVRDDNSGFGGVQLTGGPVKDGKWHHFALTRQADGTVELFLDAQSQGKDVGKNTGGPITTDLRSLGTDRFVATSGKKANPYFAGRIDEVCLYDRVLAATEIGALAGKKD